jgi:hypothetical protein
MPFIFLTKFFKYKSPAISSGNMEVNNAIVGNFDIFEILTARALTPRVEK